jgi:hypothetical protein
MATVGSPIPVDIADLGGCGAGDSPGGTGLRFLRLSEAWARRQLHLCTRSFDELPAPAALFTQHLAGPPA